MDPNETLRQIREAIQAFDDNYGEPPSESAATAVLDLFEALDGWLSKGGFLPDDWQAGEVTRAASLDERQRLLKDQEDGL